MNFDAVMIFQREDKSIEKPPRERPGFVQSYGVDERSQPTTVVGKIQEFIEIGEFESRLEGLALAHDKAMVLQRIEDLLPIRGTQDHAFDVELLAAEQQPQQPVIRSGLKLRIRALVAPR